MIVGHHLDPPRNKRARESGMVHQRPVIVAVERWMKQWAGGSSENNVADTEHIENRRKPDSIRLELYPGPKQLCHGVFSRVRPGIGVYRKVHECHQATRINRIVPADVSQIVRLRERCRKTFVAYDPAISGSSDFLQNWNARVIKSRIGLRASVMREPEQISDK